MKRKYKKVIIIISFVLIAAIGVNIFTYAYSGKNVWEYFFGNSGKDMRYLMEEYGQSVTIDGYTITLESAIFDDKTECIYSMFRISKEEGKVEASICKYNSMGNCFGEDMRFSLGINADTSSIGFTGEYEGNNLIMYGANTYHCDETEDTHAIYLYDAYQYDADTPYFENYAAKFDLKPTVNTAEISINDTMGIYITYSNKNFFHRDNKYRKHRNLLQGWLKRGSGKCQKEDRTGKFLRIPYTIGKYANLYI